MYACLDAVRLTLTALCVVPAILINFEASAGQIGALVAVSVMAAILAPVSFVVACHNENHSVRVRAGVIAAILIAFNVYNVVSLADHNDRRARDATAYATEDRARITTRLAELADARKDQVAVAGNAAVASIEAEIKAKRAASALTWNASNHCDPEHITLFATKDFCAALAGLDKRLEAAKKRDDIDKERAVKEAADVKPIQARAVWAGFALHLGLVLEAIGTGGPELLLWAFAMIDPRKGEVKITPAVEVVPQLPELRPEETNGTDPQIIAFLARNTARVTGERVKPKKLFEVWCSDCAERKIEPGTQAAFSERVARYVNKETRHNRNTWIGIALKDRAAAPKFRVISDSERS